MVIIVEGKYLFNNTEPIYNHISTDWEVSDTIDFTNIVYSSYNDTINLTSISINTTGLPLLLYFRVRYKYGDNLYTPWSNVKACYRGSWCTLDIQDINVTIFGYPDNIERAPIFTTSEFIPSAVNESHLSTDWILYDSDNNIIFQSIKDTINLTTLKLPPEYLIEGNTYKIKVRHNGYIAHSKYKEVIFTVRSDPYIETPTIWLSDNTQIATYYTIYTSHFYSNLDTEYHTATRYKITRLSDNTIIYDNYTTIHKTKISIDSTLFTNNNRYKIEVTFYGNTLTSNTGIQYFNTLPSSQWLSYGGNFTLQFSGFSNIVNGNFYTYGGRYNPITDIVYKHSIDYETYIVSKEYLDRLPYSVYRPVSIIIGDDIYIIGGYTNLNTPLNTYIIHNTIMDTYTVKELPFTYTNGNGIYIDNKIYLFGGIVNNISSNIVYELDISTKEIIEYDILPFTIHSFYLSITSSGIYLVGGIVNDDISDTIYYYDINNKKIISLVSDDNIARYDITAITNEEDIILISGKDKNGIINRQSISINTFTKNIIKIDPIPIGNHGSIILKDDYNTDSFIVIGGHTDIYNQNNKKTSYFYIKINKQEMPKFTNISCSYLYDSGNLIPCSIIYNTGITNSCNNVYNTGILNECMEVEYTSKLLTCSLTYNNGIIDSCGIIYNIGKLYSCSNEIINYTLDSCSNLFNNGINISCTIFYNTGNLDSCNIIYTNGNLDSCTNTITI